MRFFDQRTARVITTIVLFAAILGFLWLARKPLVIFLFAVLFAYLLEPLVAWFQPRVRNSRGLAILAVYVLGLVVLGVIGTLVGPRIADESRKLAQAGPKMYERVASGDIAWQLAARRGWSRETAQSVQQFLAAHRQSALDFVESLGTRGSKLATNLGWLVLIPILAIFLLKDKAKFSQATQGMVGDTRERNLLRNVLSDLDEMLEHFIRAQLYLAAISGAVYTLALGLIFRIPFGFALGIMGGFWEFIPVVGPLIAAVVILVVAFTTNYPHLLFVLLFLGVWRVIQDYVVSPRVLGGRVELHPLAAIFGVLVGAEIGGVVGVYLAIPTMAAIRILWRAGRRYQKTVEISDVTREAA
jgi:predicted PurR-regulated permease PerM